MNTEQLLEIIGGWQWLPSGFRHPWLLLLMVVPVAALVWIWTRRGRALAVPVDHALPRRGGRLRGLVHVAESIAPLLLAVAVWLWAGPLQLGKPELKRSLTNIQFCIDVSGSMTATFGEGTCYDAALAAVDNFLDLRSGDAFGLLFFGNEVLRWTPLTSDANAIRAAPPFMRPENLPPGFGGTAIGKALLDARNLLMEKPEGDRMIILVSDGASSDLDAGQDAEVARKLADASITMFGIHIGGGEVPVEVAHIAALTGGSVFAAGDESALSEVFARIDRMKKATFETTLARQKDNFQPYVAVGCLLAALQLLFSLGVRFTPW